MTMRYDDKGKYFTDVISKQRVPAMIHTGNHFIRGHIHARHNQRLKDELNIVEPFIAVTDAVVYNNTGEELHRASFLALNRNQIHWIIPENEEGQSQPSGEE
jgi:predicted ABC-type ATPase